MVLFSPASSSTCCITLCSKLGTSRADGTLSASREGCTHAKQCAYGTALRCKPWHAHMMHSSRDLHGCTTAAALPAADPAWCGSAPAGVRVPPPAPPCAPGPVQHKHALRGEKRAGKGVQLKNGSETLGHGAHHLACPDTRNKHASARTPAAGTPSPAAPGRPRCAGRPGRGPGHPGRVSPWHRPSGAECPLPLVQPPPVRVGLAAAACRTALQRRPAAQRVLQPHPSSGCWVLTCGARMGGGALEGIMLRGVRLDASGTWRRSAPQLLSRAATTFNLNTCAWLTPRCWHPPVLGLGHFHILRRRGLRGSSCRGARRSLHPHPWRQQRGGGCILHQHIILYLDGEAARHGGGAAERRGRPREGAASKEGPCVAAAVPAVGGGTDGDSGARPRPPAAAVSVSLRSAARGQPPRAPRVGAAALPYACRAAKRPQRHTLLCWWGLRCVGGRGWGVGGLGADEREGGPGLRAATDTRHKLSSTGWRRGDRCPRGPQLGLSRALSALHARASTKVARFGRRHRNSTAAGLHKRAVNQRAAGVTTQGPPSSPGTYESCAREGAPGAPGTEQAAMRAAIGPPGTLVRFKMGGARVVGSPPPLGASWALGGAGQPSRPPPGTLATTLSLRPGRQRQRRRRRRPAVCRRRSNQTTLRCVVVRGCGLPTSTTRPLTPWGPQPLPGCRQRARRLVLQA